MGRRSDRAGRGRKLKTEPAKSFVADKSLRGLGYALRHPETWPPDFVFNSRKCETCMMGLAHGLGMIAEVSLAATMSAFKLTYDETIAISCGYLNPSAADIADRIDAYYLRRE